MIKRENIEVLGPSVRVRHGPVLTDSAVRFCASCERERYKCVRFVAHARTRDSAIRSARRQLR